MMDTDQFIEHMQAEIYRYVYDNGCKTMLDVMDCLLCDMRFGMGDSLYRWFFSHGHYFENACRYNRIGLLVMFLSPAVMGDALGDKGV